MISYSENQYVDMSSLPRHIGSLAALGLAPGDGDQHSDIRLAS